MITCEKYTLNKASLNRNTGNTRSHTDWWTKCCGQRLAGTHAVFPQRQGSVPTVT